MSRQNTSAVADSIKSTLPPSDLPQVPAAITDLNAALMRLRGNLDHLAEKLNPVMASTPSSTAQAGGLAPVRALVPLAAAIQEHAVLLHVMNRDVEDLLEGIQL